MIWLVLTGGILIGGLGLIALINLVEAIGERRYERRKASMKRAVQ